MSDAAQAYHRLPLSSLLGEPQVVGVTGATAVIPPPTPVKMSARPESGFHLPVKAVSQAYVGTTQAPPSMPEPITHGNAPEVFGRLLGVVCALGKERIAVYLVWLLDALDKLLIRARFLLSS